MVQPGDAEELPDLSPEFGEMTLREVGDVTVRDVDEPPQQKAMMWKSVAAENVEQRDGEPRLPPELRDRSESELLDRPLNDYDGKTKLLAVVEWYVATHLDA